MSKNNDIAATSLASTLAGFIAKVVVHPIDTVKAKVQVNRTRIDNLKDFNKGLIAEIIQKTYSAEGMKGKSVFSKFKTHQPYWYGFISNSPKTE